MGSDSATAGAQGTASSHGSGGGPTRREVLKYGALVVAAAGAGALGTNTLAQPATVAAGLGPDQFLENGKFRVDIEGAPGASDNIQSVQVEDLTIDVREGGVDQPWRTFAPGDVHYGRVTLRARVGPQTQELRQWFEDAAVGKNVRKNISVLVLNGSGQVARRWDLQACFPVKYDPGEYSPSSTVAVETLVAKVGRIELA